MQTTQKFTQKFIAISNRSTIFIAFNVCNLPKLKNLQIKQRNILLTQLWSSNHVWETSEAMTNNSHNQVYLLIV